MDALVVQVGTRQGRVAEVTRSSGTPVAIGRAYDNDLVLTDLHVAPHQLSLVKQHDGWKLCVLDQTNPVLLNNHRVEAESGVISSGDEITVGRTRLVIFSADQPVEPTHKLVLSNWLSLESVGVLLPLATLVVVSLLDLVINFFYQSTSLKWLELTNTILISAVICLVWAGLWSIAGKIVRHQHHFGLQLIVASLISLITTFLGIIGSLLAFQLNSAVSSDIIEWLVLGLSLFLLFKLNFLIATNVRNTTLAATALTSLVISIWVGFTYLGDEEEFTALPEHSKVLAPPPLRFVPTQSQQQYFENVRDEFDAFDS